MGGLFPLTRQLANFSQTGHLRVPAFRSWLSSGHTYAPGRHFPEHVQTRATEKKTLRPEKLQHSIFHLENRIGSSSEVSADTAVAKLADRFGFSEFSRMYLCLTPCFLFKINFYILWTYSRFTTLCDFLLYGKMIQLYTRVHAFAGHFLLGFIAGG